MMNDIFYTKDNFASAIFFVSNAFECQNDTHIKDETIFRALR